MITEIVTAVLMAIARFIRFAWSTIRDHEFRALFGVVFVILAAGVVFYHNVEGWRYIDALYFSVTTLTTVGYGDIAPVTDMGKLFTIGYIIVGIGVLLSLVNVIAHHALKSRTGPDSGFDFTRIRLPDPNRLRRPKREYRYNYRP